MEELCLLPRFFNQRMTRCTKRFANVVGTATVLLVVPLAWLGISVANLARTNAGAASQNSKSFQLVAADSTTERTLRRMYLDATSRLVSDDEITAATKDGFDPIQTAESLISNAFMPESIASLWGRAKHVSPMNYPDLERFIADGNSTLSSSMTNDVRDQLQREPENILRKILADGSSFKLMFDGDASVSKASVLSLWGVSGSDVFGGTMKSGEYNDGRPNLGILATLGLTARFDTSGSFGSKRRAAALLDTLMCQNLHTENDHDFSNIDTKNLNTDLTSYAETNSPCSGCHAPIAEMQKMYRGVGEGSTFNAWKTFSASGAEPAGHYAGHEYASVARLQLNLQNDPRIRTCFVQSMLSALNQRPASAGLESKATLVSQHLLDANDDVMNIMMRSWFSTPEYRTPPQFAAVAGGTRLRVTGMKIITRRHWLGILNQLLTSSHSLFVPFALEPGFEDNLEFDWRMPSETYWHELDIFARQVASAIVERELNDSFAVDSRVLFTKLTNDQSSVTAAATVEEQLAAMWSLLTRESLSAKSRDIFYDLWTEASAEQESGIATAQKTAWKNVLTVMLMSPEFLGY
jgi:hypothetical protein